VELINKLNKQLNAKSYAKITFLLLIIFLIFHATVWNIYTKDLFNLPDGKIIGDMTRMSYDKDNTTIRNSQNKKYFSLETWDGKPVDILTIGDSFSNGGGGNYYQNYLIENKNLRVLNIQHVKVYKNYIETIIALMNTKLFEKIDPKSIIIESVQRSVISRFNKELNFNIDDKEVKFMNNIYKAGGKGPEVTFINKMNYNAFMYNILYNFDDRALTAKVYKVQLINEYFTTKKPSTLFFFKDDLRNFSKTTQKAVNRINNNFNHLATILKKKNIELYFMPVVDKYELYSPYIKNNKYSKNTFFEKIETLEKNYHLINTKKLLTSALDKGIKDVFHSDDTHWSPVAEENVFSNITFEKH